MANNSLYDHNRPYKTKKQILSSKLYTTRYSIPIIYLENHDEIGRKMKKVGKSQQQQQQQS